MSRRRLALALVLVPALVVIALGLAWREQAAIHAERVAEPPRALPAPAPGREREPEATAERTIDAPAPAPATKPTSPPVEHRDRDRTAWSQARAEISTALERRRSSPASRAPERDDEPQGTLSKEYIRERVREDVLPLVEECYGDLLERQPTTGGRMVLKFAIMGDESVGGVVDGVELAEESEIVDGDFRECLTESTMSAVFDPPEGGGRVEITYPFVFSVEPDADAPAPG
jgi:hypothetical protein